MVSSMLSTPSAPLRPLTGPSATLYRKRAAALGLTLDQLYARYDRDDADTARRLALTGCRTTQFAVIAAHAGRHGRWFQAVAS